MPSKHTIAIEQFVGLDELAPEYLEKPYFVVPENDMQAEAFGDGARGAAEDEEGGAGKDRVWRARACARDHGAMTTTSWAG